MIMHEAQTHTPPPRMCGQYQLARTSIDGCIGVLQYSCSSRCIDGCPDPSSRRHVYASHRTTGSSVRVQLRMHAPSIDRFKPHGSRERRDDEFAPRSSVITCDSSRPCTADGWHPAECRAAARRLVIPQCAVQRCRLARPQRDARPHFFFRPARVSGCIHLARRTQRRSRGLCEHSLARPRTARDRTKRDHSGFTPGDGRIRVRNLVSSCAQITLSMCSKL